MQEGVSLLSERLGSIEFLEERVHLFVLVGEVCLGYSRARYRRPGPGFDPAHPRFSIRIVWIGGTVESTYTVYTVLPPWHWIPWVEYQWNTTNSTKYSQALKPTHSHHTDPTTSKFPWRKGRSLFTGQYTPYHHQN